MPYPPPPPELPPIIQAPTPEVISTQTSPLTSISPQRIDTNHFEAQSQQIATASRLSELTPQALNPAGNAALLGPALAIYPSAQTGRQDKRLPVELSAPLDKLFESEFKRQDQPISTRQHAVTTVDGSAPWSQALQNRLSILQQVASEPTDNQDDLPESKATSRPVQPLREFIAQAGADETEPATPSLSEDMDRIKLRADRQEYNDRQRIVTATGDVEMVFRGATLQADRLEVNIPQELAVAEGDVTLTRGEQVLEGDRFEYNFVQEKGTVFNARGEVFIPTAGSDFAAAPQPVRAPDDPLPLEDLGEQIRARQPIRTVTQEGEVSVDVEVGFEDAPEAEFGSDAERGGLLNRLSFRADRIDFTADGWQAQNVRITNDPFAPPELELRAREAELVRLRSGRRAIKASRPRLVFDDDFFLPLPVSQVVIDRRERDAGLPRVGFDGEERGGLFLEREFGLVSTAKVEWSVAPQFFVQRAFAEGFDEDVAGVTSELAVNFGPRTFLQGDFDLTSLNFTNLDDELRASLRLNQLIGLYNLALEASFRDRLFNGSLGFQTVQSSIGAVVTSPDLTLGDTGIGLDYQFGIQRINAETDRDDLLSEGRDEGLVTLTRYQTSAALNRAFPLWQGRSLPATPTEGLRYSPVPIVPYLELGGEIRGIASFYSSDDSQVALTGEVELQGQLGHFSKPVLDYTAFRIAYAQSTEGEDSPFLFDRFEDRQVLTAGITQQLYGPFLFGFQTAINLDDGEQINSSFSLQYSRRTYSLSVRYDPILELGGISFRINSFNWTRGTGPFSGANVRSVEGGTLRTLE